LANVVFFFGAGASAPFDIPTMQGMVGEFEKTLGQEGTEAEQELYRRVVDFLAEVLGRPTDLEAVFTVIDSIINWSPDRLGVASIFHGWRIASIHYGEGEAPRVALQDFIPPTEEETKNANSLEAKFESFVKDACQFRKGQSARIESVYRDFFQNVGNASGGYQPRGPQGQHPYADWPMFTTNYDAVLEHYWLDHVRVPLNTGFSYDSTARMELSNPQLFSPQMGAGGLRLFKLHGSVTWLMNEQWGLTEQRVPPQGMRTYTGGKFLGQVMLYPIEEKNLYTEPYMTMYLMLNCELQQCPRWVTVGYSFGDRIVRDICVRNGNSGTILVIVHPRAQEVAKRLEGFKGIIRPIEAHFGRDRYQAVNTTVGNALRGGAYDLRIP